MSDCRFAVKLSDIFYVKFYLLNMVKFIIACLLFILPNVVFSQGIKSNVVDPFTNERTLETTIVTLKGGLSSGFGISYMAIGNNYYLNVVGYSSGDFTITEDDKIWLVLEDGNVIQFNKRAEEEGDEGEAKNIFIHHFFANMNDIETLKNKRVALVRISSPESKLTDVKISKKSGTAIQKMNEVFFNEINKAEL